MTHRAAPSRRSAFSLIELLVVIAIITILLAIGAVALTAGRRSAIKQGATAQLQRIDQACEAFKIDFNDYPPLVTVEDKGPTEEWDASDRLYRPDFQHGNELASVVNDRLRENRFGSRFSLPVYLVGVGDLNNDDRLNYAEFDEPNKDDGLDGPGFRAIGSDKFWGLAQDPNRESVSNSGRVYGPYLDPADLGDALVPEMDGAGDGAQYTINDPFGAPVLYYRNWPVRDTAGQPSVYRVPAELRSMESIAAQRAGNDASALELDRHLLGANYALLSAGFNNSYGGGDQEDFDQDLDLSNDVEYATLRLEIEDNLRVFK